MKTLALPLALVTFPHETTNALMPQVLHGRQPCIGLERRVAGWQGWGLPGVASQVTVGARVSICFDGSYSTLSGPPQIGLGGERVDGGRGGSGRGGLSCCGIGRLGYLGNHIKV